MPDFSTHTLPAAADIADLMRKTGNSLAETVIDSTDLAVTVLTTSEDARDQGWMTHTSAELVAFTATWTFESRTRGLRPQALTILQVVVGGLSDGEGWAEQSQYLVEGELTAEEAHLLGALAAQDRLPRRATWKEM